MKMAIIFSPNWKEYISIEIYAIFKNNPSPVKVYLVSDADGYIDLSNITDHFGKGYEVEFIAANDLYNQRIKTDANVSFRYTKYALYRLLLPELISEDKLLYLDADTLVTGNISDFYNMDINDKLIAGSIDIGAYTDTYDLKTPIGLSSNDIYVNAGVILMNLKKIRDENIYDQWIYEANNNHYACHDQCIINKTCRDRITTVDNKYNVSISTGLTVDKDDIKVIHFAGLYKAWDEKNKLYPDIWNNYSNEFKSYDKVQRIPKIIHYAWFGGAEKPPIIQQCIQSWKTHMPTWEIIEWNEHNFDLSKHPFALEAFSRKRYAFVTDIVRLQVLYEYGGIYMDSDVEVVKPLDKFLEHRAFSGHETHDLTFAATIGAEKNHPWVKLLLDYYKDRAYDEIPNTQIVSMLNKPLIERENNYGFKWLKDDVCIYPIEYFASYDHRNLKVIPHENAYTYHHFCGSWLSREQI